MEHPEHIMIGVMNGADASVNGASSATIADRVCPCGHDRQILHRRVQCAGRRAPAGSGENRRSGSRLERDHCRCSMLKGRHGCSNQPARRTDRARRAIGKQRRKPARDLAGSVGQPANRRRKIACKLKNHARAPVDRRVRGGAARIRRSEIRKPRLARLSSRPLAHAASSRRLRARARSGDPRRGCRARCRAGAAASASRPSRSAACGAATPGCRSAIIASRYATTSTPGGNFSVGATSVAHQPTHERDNSSCAASLVDELGQPARYPR